MGIDFGRRRCGVAVTDPLRIVATALQTVDTAALPAFVAGYCASEPVDFIVAGFPRDMRGNESESMRFIRPAIARLRKAVAGMEIVMWDERFTSAIAHRSMIDSGMSRTQRRDKSLADRMAAVLILNSFLESRQYADMQSGSRPPMP